MQEIVPNRKHFHNPLFVICATIVFFFVSQVTGSLMVLSLLKFSFAASENTQLFMYLAANMLVAVVLITAAQQLLRFNWSSIGLKAPRVRHLALIVPVFIAYFTISALFTVLATKLFPSFNAEQVQEIGFANLSQPSELLLAFLGLVVLTLSLIHI